MLLEAEHLLANCVVRKKISKKFEGGSYSNIHYCSSARENMSSLISSREVTPHFILPLLTQFGRTTLKKQFLNSLIHGNW